MIIGGEITRGQWVPLAYIWVPNKEGLSYKTVFKLIKKCLTERGLKLKAKYMMLDFEVAIRNAFEEVFPGIEVKGCHFHFGQSLWRYLVNKGLKAEYSQEGNEDLADMLHLAMALAFVPPKQFSQAFKVFQAEVKLLQPKFRPFGREFVSYFKKTWIRGNYPIQSWNYFDFDGSNTNNFLEGYNRKFNHDGGLGPKPQCYKLCTFMKSELVESAVEAFAIKRSSSGKRAPDKKYANLKLRRKDQMEKLKNGLDIRIFMISIGTMTFHGDGRIKGVHNLSTQEPKSASVSESQINSSKIDSFDESLNLTALNQERNAKAKAKIVPSDSFAMFGSSILVNYRKDSNEEDLLTLDQGFALATETMRHQGFQLSPSQKDTPKDGKMNL